MPDDDTARILAHARESASHAGAWIAAIDRDALAIDPNDKLGLLVTLHKCQRGLEWTTKEIERLRAREAEAAAIIATIGRLTAERDASAHNEREARKHLACRIEAADRARAEVERLTAERDALARLCYRKVETAMDDDAYYRIVLDTVHYQAKIYETESDVIAAIREMAGLEDRPWS